MLVKLSHLLARAVGCRFAPCAVGVGLLVGGCAIHPLPEDVTVVPTYFIMRQIRCETRQAIINSANGWLTSDDRVDAASRAIGTQFHKCGEPIFDA